MANVERRYSGKEITEVLRRAQRAPQAAPSAGAADAGLTRADLLETAREVGFDERQVALALLEYEQDQQLVRAQNELRLLAYRRFSGHLIIVALCNGLLAATGVWAGSPLWLVIAMVVWGALLLSHLRGALFPDPDKLRQKAQKRLAQQRLVQSSRELGQALTQGAARLFSATAKKIDATVSKLPPHDG
jgi:hypothetical protein